MFDINADLGFKGGPRNSRNPTKQGNMLSEFVQEFGLTVCNCGLDARGPLETYVGPTGSSMIDYIMVSADLADKVSSCLTSSDEALNTSDHRAVSITLQVENVRAKEGDKKASKLVRWDKLCQDDIQS